MGAQAVRLSNVDIDNALKNKDFEILFQPIFDLGNGALARMETFVRWRHASLGLLPPGAFISFFESQGRMSELTRYVLNEALGAYRDWRGASAPGFSINLALSDLADEAFASHFAVILRDCGFAPELITLECPMPPVDMPVDAAAKQFARLADTGARLAIEVRGRANDFLRTVDPFPFDEIKTGGAAILRFARTVRGPGLSAISELLDIANKARAAITAVGVEDQASLAALRGLGFAAAQGNHLGRVGDLKSFTPARVNDVRALLGLDPLTPADLHALFRTQAPALKASPETPAEAVAPATPTPIAADRSDALVERLAARIARQQDGAEAPAPLDEAETAPDVASEITSEIAEPAAQTSARPAPATRTAESRAAQARAAGVRAAARAAAKAAAIARARRRAATGGAEAPFDPETDAALTEPAPRALQERLSRAFGDSEAAAPESAAAAEAADEFDLPPETAGAGAEPSEPEPREPGAHETFAGTAPALDSGEAARLEDAPAPDLPAPDTFAEADLMAEPREDEEPTTEPGEGAEPQAGRMMASATADPSSAVSARLAVGPTRAFFRPGYRIGITAYPTDAPAARAPQPRPALREGAAPAPPRSAAAPAASPNTFQVQRAAPAADAVAPAPTPDIARPRFGAAKGEARAALEEFSPEPAGEALPAGEAADAAAGEVADDTEPMKPRVKRRKNFLNRVVIPYPTHFWPHSWRRAWRRRQAARVAARTTETEKPREAAE